MQTLVRVRGLPSDPCSLAATFGPFHWLQTPSLRFYNQLDKRASQIRARWQSGMFAGFVTTRPYSKGQNHDIDMDSLLGVEEDSGRQGGQGELIR
jgi:hypothetical protein